MTSKYALYEIEKISKRFAPESGVPKGVKPHYNINPATDVVVIVNRDGVNKIEKMTWGFVSTGARDTNSIFRYKSHVARAEDLFDKPTWARFIRIQRCLIPANGFYEWKNLASGRVPYYIQTADQSLLGFAGIYSVWTDSDNVEHGMCSIITTTSDTDDETVPSRIPVIIRPQDEQSWLDSSIGGMNPIYGSMKPFGPNDLKIYRVSNDVMTTKNDLPYLIERVIAK